MFGRKSQAFVQMYEYGCGSEPPTGLDAALIQMERRVQLWNRFVQIERDIRVKVRPLLSDEFEQTAIDDLRAKIACLRESIQDLRKKEGKQSPAIAHLKDQVRSCQADLATLMEGVKAHRRERLSRATAALKIIEAERAELVKQAQRDSKLYWCNYDDVRHAYEIGRIRAMKAGTELHEHHWNGWGRVTVRFQTGLPISAAMAGTDGRLQIDCVPEEAWMSPARSIRRRLARTKVRIRVASAPESRSPIWFELPVVIHRPIPADALIRSASVIRERIGVTWRYRLILTVAHPNAPTKAPADRPAIALDLGWRLVPEGIRVATWADTLGSHAS
jgi:hypothetical protein